ncbi:dephospho-CoA kinase [Rhodobacteraceae bacterium W635]|uniref:dephospho-CoA kinase n=1 Tax=Nioella halotolerans TaxID=2303578 RepID=UPI000E3DA8B5|nr:dephospho-CoA kinase [Rhodobacteraceae bacterium W635]
MSYILGMTGSIGMGKSTTARMFREEGVPVWDADAAVHRLYAQGGAAVDLIGDCCPKAVSTGAVDRDALKDWIARDETALAKLEAIVHPLVAQDRATFIADHAEAPLVVLDIPLLFETGSDRDMDGVLVVSVDAEEQRHRVVARDTMTEEMFRSILARQTPDAEKRAKADFVIETYDMDTTRAEVRNLIGKLSEADHA